LAEGASIGVREFSFLGFRSELSRFRIKFPKPYRAGFTLSRELALEARLRFGLDAPPGYIMVIKRNAGYLFVVLVEIDQSRRKHGIPQVRAAGTHGSPAPGICMAATPLGRQKLDADLRAKDAGYSEESRNAGVPGRNALPNDLK
jgi:hypothetical protein